MRRSLVPSLVLVAALVGCGETLERPDAGARRDAGFFQPNDGGPKLDAESSDGASADAPTSSDASDARLDGGSFDLGLVAQDPGDGASSDAGSADATQDAGPPKDAGAVPQGGDLVITELMVRTSSAEWLEVHNVGASPIALHTYRVTISSRSILGELVIRAPSDPSGAQGAQLLVPAGGYAVGYANPASVSDIPSQAAFLIGTPGQLGSNAFGDDGDVLAFVAPNGEGDQVDYREAAIDPAVPVGATAFPVVSGASMELDPPVDGPGGTLGNDNGGVWCAHLFGRSSPSGPNRSCRAVLISEVLFDYDSIAGGADEGREFVELAGAAGGPLANLLLVRIEGAGTSPGAVKGEVPITGARMPLDGLYVIADDGPAPATTTLVPNADQVTNLVMENGPDALQLVRVSPAVELLDAFAYGSITATRDAARSLPVVEGTPVALWGTTIYALNWRRTDDEKDSGDNARDFTYDPSPTPGTRNGTVALTLTRIRPQSLIAGTSSTVILSGTDFSDNLRVSFDQTPAPVFSCPVASITAPDLLVCRVTWPQGQAASAQRVSVSLATRQELNQRSVLTGGFAWTTANNETGTAFECDFCNLQFPATLSAAPGQESPEIYGQIYETGLTDVTVGGPAPGISAEAGYGPPGSDPRLVNWTWVPATFNGERGGTTSNNNDEFVARLTVPAAGTYVYTFRFSRDGGLTFSYGDKDGAGSHDPHAFSPTQLGSLTVQ